MSYDVIMMPVREDGAQLYEINGVVMRRLTVPEFIAFTGFNAYDLQRPETQPIKFRRDFSCVGIGMPVGGRPVDPVLKDLRGRLLSDVEITTCHRYGMCARYRCNSPFTNACGRKGNHAITVRYTDGRVWHSDGSVYAPVTEAELLDPAVLALCIPVTMESVQEAYDRLCSSTTTD